MAEKKSKYEGSAFGKLLEFDKKISLSLSLSAAKTSPLGNFRSHMKALEYSCHGVFWICGSMILLWLSEDPVKETFFFNMLLALLLDIVFVAVLKALLRRRRPENNESDMFMTLSVDKMSCPSGHTTRAVLVTYLLIWCTPQKYVLHLVLLIWCICTCASRVLLGRHHLGDVLVGAVVGYVEYWIMESVWAGPDSAKWYLDFFRDSNSIVEDL